MNKEKFIQYLQNPAQLYELNYQELKSLVVEFPYCQNLRFLLAKKSQLDQSNEFERDLRNAASCVASRTYLFQRLNDAKSRPRRASYVTPTENSLEIDHLSSPSKPTDPKTNDLREEAVSIPENIIDPETSSPAEAKGDNAPPSESPPEIKKNEPGNRSSELRISSEKVHLAEKAIIPPVDLVDSKEKDVPFLKDLTPVKKVIHQRIIKKAPPIKSDLAKNKIVKPTIEEKIVANQPKEESDLVAEVPNLIPSKTFDLPETETELIELKEKEVSFKDETAESMEEVEEITLPPLFPIEPAQSTINNIVIVEPQEDELEEIFPPSFDDHDSEIENLKSNIPFEITNEDDFTEEIELVSPSPKSDFNSWIKEFKSKKSKKKSQKKKAKTNNQVEEITKKKKKDKKKGKGRKSKKLISKIIKSKKKTKKEEELLPKAKVKVPKKEKKQKVKKNKIATESVKAKVDLPPVKEIKATKEKKKKKVKKKKKKDGTKSFALKSIVENKEIASETLAEILVEQGSIQKAINMYERLSLIFPEKSTFFAKRIEKLKNI